MARVRGDSFIGVEDLDKIAKALKQIDPSLTKRLRLAGKAAADEVVPKARSKASSLGSTAAHVAPSIKASAGAQFAGIAVGGGAYPMGPGAEFGGRGRPTTQQFQPWRGNGEDAGYFMWPTIRENLPQIEETYIKGVNELLQEVGLG